MAAEGVEGVVIAKPLLDERHGEEAHDAPGEADDEGGPQGDEAAAGRDGDEADHETGRRADERGFLAGDHIHEHPGELGRGGGDGRGGERVGSKVTGREGAAGVEAEPPEEQERCADGDERDVMHAIADVVVALAASEQQAENERRNARRDMDHVAARKVNGTHLCQQPAAPDHVRHRVVDDEGPEDHEEEERLEAHASGDRPGDERGRDDREHHLEQGEDQQRNGGGIRVRRRLDAIHEQVLEASDDAAMISPER